MGTFLCHICHSLHPSMPMPVKCSDRKSPIAPLPSPCLPGTSDSCVIPAGGHGWEPCSHCVASGSISTDHPLVRTAQDQAGLSGSTAHWPQPGQHFLKFLKMLFILCYSVLSIVDLQCCVLKYFLKLQVFLIASNNPIEKEFFMEFPLWLCELRI